MDDNTNELPSLDSLLDGIEDSPKTMQSQKKESIPKSNGNAFHKAFQSDKIDDSELLETINNYQDEGLHLDMKNKDIEETDPFVLMKRKEEAVFQQNHKKMKSMLLFSQVGLGLSVFFIIASFLTFSMLLDTPSNGLLGDFTGNNYGTDLEEKKKDKVSLEKDEKGLKDEIKKEKTLISELEDSSVLKEIIDKRIDWIGILQEINKARCYADPDSDINKCMGDMLNNSTAFNPFTFENYTTKEDPKTGLIEVLISGKVQGSQGYIFKKTTQLIEAFNESKYFSGATMDRFSKTKDNRLGFYMPFSIKLVYHKDGKEEAEITTSAK